MPSPCTPAHADEPLLQAPHHPKPDRQLSFDHGRGLPLAEAGSELSVLHSQQKLYLLRLHAARTHGALQ